MLSAASLPRWRLMALCSKVEGCTDVFFPSLGARVIEVRRVCRACPVRERCLIDSLADDLVRVGIRGGLAQRPQATLRRHGEYETPEGDVWLYDAETGEAVVIENDAVPMLTADEAIALLTALRDRLAADDDAEADEDAALLAS